MLLLLDAGWLVAAPADDEGRDDEDEPGAALELCRLDDSMAPLLTKGLLDGAAALVAAWLLDDGAALLGTTVLLDENTVLLDERTVLLDERTALLDERTALLDERTALLDERTAAPLLEAAVMISRSQYPSLQTCPLKQSLAPLHARPTVSAEHPTLTTTLSANPRVMSRTPHLVLIAAAPLRSGVRT